MSWVETPRSDRVLVGVSAVVLLLVLLIAVLREAAPAWERTQEDVREVVTATLGADAAKELPKGIQQIWIPELDRVDRCVTCHQTIEWGNELADAPNPARSHPRPDLLASHPPERFGCTLCHGGQGVATTKEDAHGDVPHWEEPLLDGRRARLYGLTAAELLEMRCNACHRQETDVAGMPLLNAAKAELVNRQCWRCHVVGGQGGTKGPELTWEGDKHPSRYAFPAAMHPKTALQWQIEHLQDPAAVTPGSEMTKFRLSAEQVRGLAVLLLSWRRVALPPAWIPRGEPR